MRRGASAILGSTNNLRLNQLGGGLGFADGWQRFVTPRSRLTSTSWCKDHRARRRRITRAWAQRLRKRRANTYSK
jgi:hypothetical protein